jgi:triacylglycerol lipase
MREWVVVLLTVLVACAEPEVHVEEPGEEPDTGVPALEGAEPTVPCRLDDGSGALTSVIEGAFIAQGSTLDADRGRCIAAQHAIAGAAGSSLKVELQAWSGEGAARLEVRDLLGEAVASIEGAEAGSSITFTLDRSGEFLVHLEPLDPGQAADSYELALTCAQACDLEYTRHPIVLMHGMGGTDAYLELLDYFWQVPEHLQDHGYHVHQPAVAPFDPIEERAVQWVEHLDWLVEHGQARRFNMIGHSQGGLDARLLIWDHGYADRVVSLTTISSPHHGTPTADVVNGLVDVSPLDGAIIDAAMTALYDLMGLGEQDAAEALASITTEAMVEFNDTYPDHPGVAYYSWAGHSCGILEWECIEDYNGEVVDVLLGPTYTLIWAFGMANDGQVPTESGMWGVWLGELPADHADEVGHIMDEDNPPFDHLEFYLGEARRLAAEGF